MSLMRTVYNHSPYWLKVSMVSLLGLKKSWWRNWNRASITAAITNYESLPRTDAEAQNKSKLYDMLHHAYNTVPYYRNYLSVDPKELSSWPILTKSAFRTNPDHFISNKYSHRIRETVYTSGTTGKPLKISLSREATSIWYAMHETRALGWHKIDPHSSWINFGGQLVSPIRSKNPPFWVHNFGLKQLYFSSYHLSAETAAYYLEKLDDFMPDYIYGYTSSIYQLARLSKELNIPVKHVTKKIYTNAEPLLEYQRKLIEEVYQTEVVETYGSSERIIGANQCSHGKLHYYSDACHLEILDEQGIPVENGQVGKVVVTTLINKAQPLIRYDLGDSIRLAKVQQCPCGSSLPIIDEVVGRNDDLIITPDGNLIGRLDPVFKGDMDIKEAQIIQVARDKLVLKIVKGESYNSKTEKQIKNQLAERLGDMLITFQYPNEIPKLSNGKFKAVWNKSST